MKRILVESTSIKSIGYDFAQKILEVEFIRGTICQYLNVPQQVFSDLYSVQSKGKYFSKNIAKNYEFKKVSE